jgi:hypothetical protein
MKCFLVSIPFVDLEAMVDSAIQMEGKLNQASENRKRHMIYQGNSRNAHKPRGNPSLGSPLDQIGRLHLHCAPTTPTVREATTLTVHPRGLVVTTSTLPLQG